MDLNEFIKSTLLDIMSGVAEAQRAWQDKADGVGVINPSWDGVKAADASKVKFDVAVSAESGGEHKVGGGIKVWSIGASGELGDNFKNSTVSRVQFEVPIIPPVIDIKPAKPLVNMTIPSTQTAFQTHARPAPR